MNISTAAKCSGAFFVAFYHSLAYNDIMRIMRLGKLMFIAQPDYDFVGEGLDPPSQQAVTNSPKPNVNS